MRVTVVGAGIMGLSTAWALAGRGHAVTVIDQGPVPNPLGSSVDQHRLIRFPYGSMTGYARLVAPAFRAWDRLWADLGSVYYRETGTLILGTGGHPWVEASVAALTEMGVGFRELEPAAVAESFPLLDGNGVARAVYLESGGVLLADRIVDALGSHLVREGVEVMAHRRVDSVDLDTATVETDDGERVTADWVVVAAGPWLPSLLPGFEGRAVPSRQVVTYLSPPSELVSAWERMPMVLDLSPEGIFYVVPPVMGTGLKIGDHSFSMTGHPDSDRVPTREEGASLVALTGGRFTDIDRYRTTGSKTCFYTVASDERFIVEPAGGSGVVLTGFSGHGFKFGPLVGEMTADLIDGTRAASEVQTLLAGHVDADLRKHTSS